MVKNAFILVCGLIVGALLIENKHRFTHRIPIPIAELPDAGVYEGPLNRGRFHGSGRIVWPGNSYYEGEFVDGLFQGQGVFHSEESLYRGEFTEGHMTGQGTIDYLQGGKYEGGVRFGLPHGEGVLSFDGGKYTGEFESGTYQGHGELLMDDGSRYQGGFVAGLYHGKGVFSQPLGAVSNTGKTEISDIPVISYQGDFVKGEFTGKGVMLNGDAFYEGDFVAWKFQGKGIYTVDGFRYEGAFLDGLFHGQGETDTASGESYKGAFAQGGYEGQGVLVSDVGDIYTGNFSNGKFHGAGVLAYAQELDGIKAVTGEWVYGRLVKSDQPQLVVNPEALAEHALYNQHQVLDRHLSQIKPSQPEQIDLYFVGVAGDGTQGVFRRELDFVRDLFDTHYGTDHKSINLVNSPLTYANTPLATVTSIDKTLQHVAEKMDPENDILFLYLSSHGSRDFQFDLSLPGLSLPDLKAKELGEMLERLPVKHKIVVISACFSGGFIPHVKSSTTLVIAAAEADKTSFGCHDRSVMTYFGEAFFKDSLSQSPTFVDAFYRARDIVKEREASEGFENSNPLIFKPKAIEAHLKKWREQRQLQAEKNIELSVFDEVKPKVTVKGVVPEGAELKKKAPEK